MYLRRAKLREERKRKTPTHLTKSGPNCTKEKGLKRPLAKHRKTPPRLEARRRADQTVRGTRDTNLNGELDGTTQRAPEARPRPLMYANSSKEKDEPLSSTPLLLSPEHG